MDKQNTLFCSLHTFNASEHLLQSCLKWYAAIAVLRV